MLCSSKPNSARHPPVSVLLGAGISVAAGIPDLRSCGGMYDTLQPELLTASKEERDIMREDPTFVMSTALFRENQLPLLEFLRPLILNVADHKWQPTLSHRFLELLHEKGAIHQPFLALFSSAMPFD